MNAILLLAVLAHPGAGLVVDRDGTLFFVDAVRDGSNRIMKVGRDGKLSTFFQSDEVRVMHHLVLGAGGVLYTASDDGRVWAIDRSGKASPYYPEKDGPRRLLIGSGGDPFTVDSRGHIYFVNDRQFRMCQILKVEPDGRVASVAGGAWGHADGSVEDARFEDLHSSVMTFGPDGALYLTDNGTRVRRIADGRVTTVAEGLEHAGGLTVDGQGTVVVAETGRRRVVRIHEGRSTVLSSEFASPVGVAVSGEAVFVLDHEEREGRVRIWKVTGGRAEVLATVP